MNQRMDKMANEFEDIQCANDHGGIQNRLEWREFNVRRIVRWVNIDVDEFVADNVNMSDVDFEDVSLGHGECFG
jgi:hypothetical protein